MMFNFSIDMKGVSIAQQVPEKAANIIRRADSAALNRAITHGRQVAVSHIRGKYLVKAGDVRKSMKISKSTPVNLLATIDTTGRPMPLTDFKVTPKKPRPNTRRKRKPLSVEIKRGAKRTLRPALFVVKGKRLQKNQVVKRGDDGSLSVEYGPSIPMMFTRDFCKELGEECRGTYEKRLAHEIAHRLGGK